MAGSFDITAYFKALETPTDWPSTDELTQSIKNHGCVMPVLVWAEENTLIDGHRRVQICRDEGVEFQELRISFPSREAAAKFVQEQQACRRNLTPEQIKARRAEYVKGRIEPPSQVGTNAPTKTGGRKAAKSLGVNYSTIKRDIKKGKAVAKLPESVRELPLTFNQAEDAAVLVESGMEPEKVADVVQIAADKKIKISDALQESGHELRPEHRLAVMYENVVKILDSAIRALKPLQESVELRPIYTDGVHTRILDHIKQARSTVKFATPETHARCKGLGCKQCDERGWINNGSNK